MDRETTVGGPAAGLAGAREVGSDEERRQRGWRVERRARLLMDVLRRVLERQGEASLAEALAAIQSAPSDAGEIRWAAVTRAAEAWIADRPDEMEQRRERLASALRLALVLVGIAGQAESVPLPTLDVIGRGDRRRDRLEALEVRLVATAHPTRARRERIVEHCRLIDSALRALGGERLRREHQREQIEAIETAVEALWATRWTDWEPSTVEDEIDHVLGLFERSVLDAVGELERAVVRAGLGTLGRPRGGARPTLRFGSWVGADMDGRPDVGSSTLSSALEKHRRVAIERHVRVTRDLARRLSHRWSAAPPSPPLRHRCEAMLAEATRAGRSTEEVRLELEREPYRAFLTLVAQRLEHTLGVLSFDRAELSRPPWVYLDPSELLEDLRAVEESLRHAGQVAAADLVRFELAVPVEVFGFHLASVDVREDAVHVRAAARTLIALADDEGSSQSDGELEARLLQELEGPRGILPWPLHLHPSSPVPGAPDLYPSVRRLFEVLRMIRRAHAALGPAACRHVVLTRTSQPADVLAFLLLAKSEGLFRVTHGGMVESDIDVIPTFETIADLERAPRVLERLFALPIYRRQLAARDDRQVVMVGFADSGLDGGFLASRWAVFRAQEAMLEVARGAGIALRFFHGRGGGPGRGMDPTRTAVAMLPPGAVDQGFDQTEPGEVLAWHYGTRSRATRHLRQVLVALVDRPRPPAGPDLEGWRPVIDELAERAFGAYRELVHEDPTLLGFFDAVTPHELERTRREVRRPRRGRGGPLDELRSLPWELRWQQTRIGLPGWYGFGAAVEGWLAGQADPDEALRRLREMRMRWPFFAQLLERAAAALADTDLGVAERYVLTLAPEGVSTERIWGRIRAEHARTEAVLVRLGEPIQRRDMVGHWRATLLDGLHHLQIGLVEGLRRGRDGSELAESALQTTFEGISEALS